MSSLAPSTKQLLNRLASWKSSVRQAAIGEAKQLDPDALLDLMQQGRRRLQKRRRQRCLFALVFLVAYFTTVGSMGNDTFHYWRFVNSAIFQAVLWGLILTVAPKLKVSLTAVFEDMQKVAFVPHLLTLLASYGLLEEGEVQKTHTALERLLPGMNRKQLDALTPLQRQTFLKPLVQSLKYNNRGKEAAVHRTEVILWTLEQIGDRRELPLVEQLAAIKTRTDMDRRIQQAAAECLPYLQIRAEEQRQQTTLLRASDVALVGGGEVLLRSANSAPSAAPDEQLLRATRQE